MKCSLNISNFLEEISTLPHSIVFLYIQKALVKQKIGHHQVKESWQVSQADGCQVSGMNDNNFPHVSRLTCQVSEHSAPRGSMGLQDTVPLMAFNGHHCLLLTLAVLWFLTLFHNLVTDFSLYLISDLSHLLVSDLTFSLAPDLNPAPCV